ncbi:ABC-type uncharacterized transport system permease subunit [Pseudomonas psychrotolerans]|nr:ABC-type uncharacterized transport system permease subunit [Pseudomonas psychrotolerans]
MLLGLDEQNRIALHLADSGQATFFTLADGQPVLREQLPLPPGVSITSQAQDAPRSLIALGLSDGRVLVAHKRYVSSYPEGSRVITPELDFPYGREPLDLGAPAIALDRVAIAGTDDLLVLAGAQGKRVTALRLARPTAPLGGGAASKVRIVTALAPLNAAVKALYLDPRGQWLYVLNGRAQADVFNLHDGSLNGHYKLLDTADDEVTASAQLLGGVSLLVGTAKGGIAQWFLVRGQDGEPVLRHIRSFQLGTAPIVQIVPEQRRKGFLALDSQGWLGVFHSTAGRTLLRERIAPAAGVLALSPRADRLLLEQGGQLQGFILTNPHPEISWSALWDKVWYENYEAPARVWQSSATTTDFEPKLSLAPLTFGTLKAAFYAMLFAAPLAVAAAIYTAYFMAPRMRRTVKPVIELMEALPTVILGFFAGLFLAPFVENHLPGLFSLLLLLPLAILAAGFGWARLPLAWRERVPEGWESLLLLPVLLLTSALGPQPQPLAGEPAVRRRPAPLAEPGTGHRLRPAQCPDRRHGHGLRRHPQHLLHRRGRPLQRAAQPDPGFAGARRHALADADAGGAAHRQPRHLLGADDRPGSRRGRNHDRAHGHRQHPDHGRQPVRGHAYPGGQHRRGNARVRGGQHPLPVAVPGRPGAAQLHLPDEHPGRADPPAAEEEVCGALRCGHRKGRAPPRGAPWAAGCRAARPASGSAPAP